MNTPNPLVPQGALPQSTRSKSTVRIAVFTIVAIHAVFFAGLLMQGCKRDDGPKSTVKQSDLTSPANELAKLDTNYFAPQAESAAATNTPASYSPNAVAVVTTHQPLSPSTAVTPVPLPGDATASALSAETKEYSIVKGDTLAKIAKANHVTVGELTKLNGGLDPKKLKVNQKIQIPVAARNAAGGAGGLGFAEPPKPELGAASGSQHVVKAGDTLTKIAKQHHVSVKALRSENQLKTDRLIVNQKLKIPAATTGGSGTTGATGHAASPATTTLSATNPVGVPTVR